MKVAGKYYMLKEVIFLAIADFTMFPNKKGYKSEHVILDKATHEHDLKDFSFTFLELKKFDKAIEELRTYEEKWMYFFKHADEPENVERLIKSSSDAIIKKAYTELEAHNWTQDELLAYESVQKAHWDAQAREDYVRDEGKAEGEAKRNIEIAKNLLSEGLDVKLVSKTTGLSESAVKDLEK
jgi:predicted transposase/invertase (TIGR01784 family)